MKNNLPNYNKYRLAKYRGKYLDKDIYVCSVCSRYMHKTPDNTCPHCKTVVVYEKENKTEDST